jgi:hypothetical protein
MMLANPKPGLAAPAGTASSLLNMLMLFWCRWCRQG